MKFTEKQQIQQVKDTYNQIADEFSATRKGSWSEFELIFPNLKSGSILDIGCGNGRFYAYLPLHFQEKYLGIDISENLIKHAQKNHQEGKFEVGNFLQLPDQKFQNIVAIASFHHLPSVKTRKQALSKMYDTLNQDGQLFITVWNLYQEKYLQFIDENGHSQIPWGDNKIPRYYYAFREDELRKLIQQAGFKIKNIQKAHNIYIHAEKN